MLGGKPLLQLLAGRDQALGLGLTQVELDAVAEQGGIATESASSSPPGRGDRVAAGELAQPDVVVAREQDLGRAVAAAGQQVVDHLAAVVAPVDEVAEMDHERIAAAAAVAQVGPDQLLDP